MLFVNVGARVQDGFDCLVFSNARVYPLPAVVQGDAKYNGPRRPEMFAYQAGCASSGNLPLILVGGSSPCSLSPSTWHAIAASGSGRRRSCQLRSRGRAPADSPDWTGPRPAGRGPMCYSIPTGQREDSILKIRNSSGEADLESGDPLGCGPGESRF